MKIRHFVRVLVVVGILSIGAFGQSVTGRVTGIAVDPNDPSGVIVVIVNAVLLALR